MVNTHDNLIIRCTGINMYTYDEITTVHLEVTQRCQASCPMCDRNENGGPDNKHITNAELTMEDCKQIFKPEFIRQLKTMYMCGNLGDPIMARDTLEIFNYFREHNPTMWLSMNTNAGAKNSSWWYALAKTFGNNGAVIFSIDGLADTNHMYRQGVNWNNVYRNAKAFIAAGGRARWDYLIFQHNEHQVDAAEELSQTMGFERFIKKKSGRFITVNSTSKDSHQAKNRKGEDTAVIAKPDQESNQNTALAKQSEIEKTYGSMREYYDSCTVKCKVAEEKNIFITAEGLLMPCCWTAGRMYKWWHKDYRVEQIWDHIDSAGGKDAINTITNGLESVMQGQLLNSIQASWNKPSLKEGKLGVCAMKCGSEFDPFKAQFI
jgi:MoaA/NifB/PqqE/SkfB family radical SAM enzyme